MSDCEGGQSSSSCWLAEYKRKLGEAGLRATRQRMQIGMAVFAGGQHRHFTAQEVYRTIKQQTGSGQLATVYNTLNILSEKGILRRIHTGNGVYIYDTNCSQHIHMITEIEGSPQVIQDARDLDEIMPKLSAIRDSHRQILVKLAI